MIKTKKYKRDRHLGTIETRISVFVDGMRVHVAKQDKLEREILKLPKDEREPFLRGLVEATLNVGKHQTTPAMQKYFDVMMPTMEILYPSDGSSDGPAITTPEAWQENIRKCFAELERSESEVK